MDASVWLVGEFRAAEFSQAVAWLCKQAACQSFDDARDAVAQATRRGASADQNCHDPYAIVFCAARPGSISRRQVDAVSRAFPLARLVALVGTWCEGELRSGRPWPGVPRIYWHQWQTRLSDAINEFDSSMLPRLPRTATNVDVLLSSQGRARPATMAARVGIVTERRTDFESLAGAINPETEHCRWLLPREVTPLEPLDLLLVDVPGDLAAAGEDLQRLRCELGPVPALVLCHFPRPDELQDLPATAPTAFLAKPYLVGDLLLSMAALLGLPAAQVPASASAAA
jgi:hypothetical protein